jgi:hypothetical protein
LSEHGSPKWRPWIAGGVFVAILIAAILIVRQPQPEQVEVTPPPWSKAPAITSPPPPSLTRADLIDAAARAADAYATGSPSPGEIAALAGRRFTLHLPFGCGGPAEDSEAPAQWTYNAEAGTLRAKVTPEVWTDDAFVRSIAGETFEAAEGFWISRPWIRRGDCPRIEPGSAGPQAESAEGGNSAAVEAEPESPSADASAPPALVETLALIELFRPETRRASRRNGQPYELVRKLALAEIDLQRGLRLVVDGRLAELREGQSIACGGNGNERPPLCLIGAQIDRIAITDASGEHILAEWTD